MDNQLRGEVVVYFLTTLRGLDGGAIVVQQELHRENNVTHQQAVGLWKDVRGMNHQRLPSASKARRPDDVVILYTWTVTGS